MGLLDVVRQVYLSQALHQTSVFHAVDDQSEVLDEVGLDEDDDDETLTKTLFLGDAAERSADG